MIRELDYQLPEDVFRVLEYRFDVARRRRKARLRKGIAKLTLLAILLLLTTFAAKQMSFAESQPETIRAEMELIPQEDGSILVVNH